MRKYSETISDLSSAMKDVADLHAENARLLRRVALLRGALLEVTVDLPNLSSAVVIAKRALAETDD